MKPGDLVHPRDFSIGTNRSRVGYDGHPPDDGLTAMVWVTYDTLGIVLESRYSSARANFGGRMVWMDEHDLEVLR